MRNYNTLGLERYLAYRPGVGGKGRETSQNGNSLAYIWEDNVYYVKKEHLLVTDLKTGKEYLCCSLDKFYEAGCSSYVQFYIFVNDFGIYLYHIINEQSTKGGRELLILFVPHTYEDIKFWALSEEGYQLSSVYISGEKVYYIATDSTDSFDWPEEYFCKVSYSDAGQYSPDKISYFGSDHGPSKGYHLPTNLTNKANKILEFDVRTGSKSVIFSSLNLGHYQITVTNEASNSLRANDDYLFFYVRECWVEHFQGDDEDEDCTYVRTDYPSNACLLDLNTKELKLIRDHRITDFDTVNNRLILGRNWKHDSRYDVIPADRPETPPEPWIDFWGFRGENGVYWGHGHYFSCEEYSIRKVRRQELSSNWKTEDARVSRQCHIQCNDSYVLLDDDDFHPTFSIRELTDTKDVGDMIMTIDFKNGDLPEEYHRAQSKETCLPSVSQMELFYMSYKGAEATGYPTPTGFTVCRGSVINEELVPSCPISVVNLRQKHISSIRDHSLTTDLEFSSISAAASFIAGASQNGKVAWKDSKGRTYKEIYHD